MDLGRIEKLEPEGPTAPNFCSRIVSYREPCDIPPFKAYLHNFGKESFEPNRNDNRGLTNLPAMASQYLIQMLVVNEELVKGADFLIAGLWGDKDKNRMVDLIKYSTFDKWGGNPVMENYVLQEGILRPEVKPGMCGDMLIVLGAEEQFRRTTLDIVDYMQRNPDIPGLRVM